MAARDSHGYLIEVGDRVTRISGGSSDTLSVGETYTVSSIGSNGWLSLEGVSGQFSPVLFERENALVQQAIDLNRFNVKVEDWANQSHYIAITEKPADGSQGGSPVFSFFSIGERPDPTNAVQITNLAKQDRCRVILGLIDNWYKILDKINLPPDVEIEDIKRRLSMVGKEYSNSSTPSGQVSLGRRIDLVS